MTPEQRSSLNLAVSELAEQLAAACSLSARIINQSGVVQAYLVGSRHEMLITTEGDEITLAFGFGHQHFYRWYEDDLAESVKEVRSLALGIFQGDTVSFQVLAGDQPLGGGFSAANETHLIGDRTMWSRRWQFIQVMGWNPVDDRAIERVSK